MLNLLDFPGVRIGVIGTLVNDYELLASSPHVTFHSTSHPRGVEATSLFEVQHIQHVVVEYFRRSYDMDGSPCNTIAEPDGGEAWMAFVDLMSRFPRLRSVVFAFDDEADKRAFVVRNSKALQQLQQSITTRLVDLPWPVGDRRKPSFVESDYYDGASFADVAVCFCLLNLRYSRHCFGNITELLGTDN